MPDAAETVAERIGDEAMKPIWYASAHQAISALHSIVCIPTHYTEGLPPIEEWGQFELQEYDWRGHLPELPQPTKWIRTGPVWRPAEPANGAAVEVLRTLWPFKGSWIQPGYSIQCFRAELQGAPSRQVLARMVADALDAIRQPGTRHIG